MTYYTNYRDEEKEEEEPGGHCVTPVRHQGDQFQKMQGGLKGMVSRDAGKLLKIESVFSV